MLSKKNYLITVQYDCFCIRPISSIVSEIHLLIAKYRKKNEHFCNIFFIRTH